MLRLGYIYSDNMGVVFSPGLEWEDADQKSWDWLNTYAESESSIIFYFTVDSTDIWEDEPKGLSVGKYEPLFVYENDKGWRWSVHKLKWVSPDSNDWTSFLTDELAELFMSKKPVTVPTNGVWIDINDD